MRAKSGAAGWRDAAISSAPMYGTSSAAAYCFAMVVLPDPFGPPTIKSLGFSINRLFHSFDLIRSEHRTSEITRDGELIIHHSRRCKPSSRACHRSVLFLSSRLYPIRDATAAIRRVPIDAIGGCGGQSERNESRSVSREQNPEKPPENVSGFGSRPSLSLTLNATFSQVFSSCMTESPCSSTGSSR